jgi:hypothetical protein
MVLPLIIAGAALHGQSAAAATLARQLHAGVPATVAAHAVSQVARQKVPASDEDCPLRCLLKHLHL